jgi:hypothetical protein
MRPPSVAPQPSSRRLSLAGRCCRQLLLWTHSHSRCYKGEVEGIHTLPCSPGADAEEVAPRRPPTRLLPHPFHCAPLREPSRRKTLPSPAKHPRTASAAPFRCVGIFLFRSCGEVVGASEQPGPCRSVGRGGDISQSLKWITGTPTSSLSACRSPRSDCPRGS